MWCVCGGMWKWVWVPRSSLCVGGFTTPLLPVPDSNWPPRIAEFSRDGQGNYDLESFAQQSRDGLVSTGGFSWQVGIPGVALHRAVRASRLRPTPIER